MHLGIIMGLKSLTSNLDTEVFDGFGFVRDRQGFVDHHGAASCLRLYRVALLIGCSFFEGEHHLLEEAV